MDNGSSNEAGPSFEMPIPSPENGGEAQQDAAHEQAAPQESKVGRQQPAQSLPAQPIVLPPVVDDTQAVTAVDDTTQQAVDDSKQEETHISEKQWVEKAKSIVAENKDDPFVQKKEMSDFKAQYIKKRFNKTIPRDDAVKA